MTCPWWVRWWHRRLRYADRRFLWPLLAQEADPVRRRHAADLFLRGRGQEHWHCPCGHADYRALKEQI